MKSFRWTLIALGAVALLIAFTIYDTKRHESSEEAKQKTMRVLSLRATDIVRLEFHKSRTQEPPTVIQREKVGSPWLLKSPVEDSTDDGIVPGLVGWLDEEKSLDVVVDGEDFDAKVYGLDRPSFTLTVQASDGRSEKVKIGSVDAYDGNLYAQIEGQKRVLLVGNMWDMQMSKPVREFRDKNLVQNQVPHGEVAKIFIRKNKTSFVLERSGTQEAPIWKITNGERESNEVPLAPDRVRSFIEAAQSTKAVDFLGDAQDEERLRKHKLLTPALEIELFKSGGDRIAKLAFADTGGRSDALDVAAISTERKPIFEVQGGTVEALAKNPSDFYDRKYPFAFDVDKVGRIKIETPEVTGEFVKKGETWSALQEGLQTSIDSGVLNELPAKIGRLEAIRYFDESHDKSSSSKTPKRKGRIVLLKDSGESLLELNWGEVRKDASVSGQPETQLRTAWTSRIERKVGISEGSLKGLRLDSILGKSQQDPTK